MSALHQPPAPPATTRNPDLTETLIIILISAGVLVFLFWISTRFLGEDKFQNLPDWLVAVFKNIWAAVATGATGIGLALVKAFRNRGRPQPNYFKYIAVCVLAGLLPIGGIVAASFMTKPKWPDAVQPPNTSTIDYSNSGESTFDLETPSTIFVLKYTLQGTFIVKNGVLFGRLSRGTIEVPKNLPEPFPHSINRISFRACYNDKTNPQFLRNVFPPYAKSRDSLDVNLPLTAGAKYSLEPGNFAFDLPPQRNVKDAWLCAVIKTEWSEFPAE